MDRGSSSTEDSVSTNTISRTLAVKTQPTVTVTEMTNNTVKLEVTPTWFVPVQNVTLKNIRFPVNHNDKSPAVVRKFECLSKFRSMTGQTDEAIDFISHPFEPSVNDTETAVVVLNEVIQQLGSQLIFTKDSFKYDDSDYRTACGVGDLGSIHSFLSLGNDVQTAKFRPHINLNYDDITRTPDTLKRFTVSFINDISATLNCKREFIRVFSVTRASSFFVDFGITTTNFQETKNYAEQFKHLLINLDKTQRTDILQYLISEKYDYYMENALTYLQIQPDDLEPEYNRDYPYQQEEIRGGRPYFFPKGWYRHALKVVNKYPQDKQWLTMDNSPGEWAVAYHGTKPIAARGIVDKGLLHSKVTADAYKSDAECNNPLIPKVQGIYLATHCEHGASGYTDGFPVKGSNGIEKTYRIVFQCRVQPGKYTEHTGPVEVGTALRVFDEKGIRPYGLLLRTDEDFNNEDFSHEDFIDESF